MAAMKGKNIVKKLKIDVRSSEMIYNQQISYSSWLIIVNMKKNPQKKISRSSCSY